MKEEIRKRLVALNQLMYEGVYKEFSDSRSYNWEGWDIAMHHIPAYQKRSISILDLGCGNGRFGCFLKERGYVFDYTGVDVSKKLLGIAEQKLKKCEVDIIALIAGDIEENINSVNGTYDMIVLLGVLHHIPGQEQRELLIRELGGHLSASGSLIFTTWNFLQDHRLMKRLVDPSVIHLDKNYLEKGDHLMRWSRGVEMIRYVHAFDRIEVDALIRSSGLCEKATFQADGKSGSLNDYHILQKKDLS